MTPSIVLAGISHAFGSVKALDQVNFSAWPGEIHALVGENGAGKTTLMKALYGALQPDSGSIQLHGKPVSFRSSKEAIAAGIGMVSQHYAIIPDLSCLQNLMLGAEPSWLIDAASSEKRARQLASEMGFEFDWSSPASSLTPGDAQKLEILKLLWRKADVMILDEPTAMLSPRDADQLYASLRGLAESGRTVIVVTHRIPEVMDYCDRVSVLRGGKFYGEHRPSDLTSASLAELIVGQSLPSAESKSALVGNPALNFAQVSVRGSRGDLALAEASLEVREGEILGVAGVDGSGQVELFRAALGIVHPSSGSIQMFGQPAPKSVRDRIAAGVRIIPPDRQHEAVLEDWTLEENALLGLQRLPENQSNGWILPSARAEFAQQAADRFDTKRSSLKQKMVSLSGGNQQRFVAGRALCSQPKLILAYQPARGLDLLAARRIYDEIRRLCREEKAAALVVSLDLEELMENCDRIGVLCQGRWTEPPLDRAAIGESMVGSRA